MGLFGKKDKNAQAINRQAPQFWKMEIFYFNKQDRNIIVPSRYGSGFAFNYGNKIVQIVMSLFGAAVVAAIVLLFVL